MVFALVLIVGVLIPVISVSLNQLQASPGGSWERQGYSDCTKCHTRYLPGTPTFTATQTVNTRLCRNCHDTVQFGALSTEAGDAHSNHLGLMSADRPAGSKGTASKHPKLANLIRSVDFGECSACHRSLAGGLAGWNCTSCHAPATATHIKAHINDNCSTCHGALPTITYHSSVTISAGNHSVLGGGRYGCFACHNNQTTGVTGYRLANGTVISASDPSKLCWQCHSDYYKDWKAGNHHDSTKQCTDESCHNPHEPYLPRAAAAAPTQIISVSPTFLFGAAIAVVVIIGVAIYLLKRKRK